MIRILKRASRILPFLKRRLEFYRQKIGMRLLYLKHSISPVSEDLTLFWVPGGMPLMLDVETSLAAALKLRGQKVHAIICDGTFKACVKREITENVPMEEWASVCHGCKKGCSEVLEKMGIPYSWNGDYLSEEEKLQLRKMAEGVDWSTVSALEHEEIPVGNNIRSSILRFLKGYNVPKDRKLVSEYAFSGLLTATAAKNAFEKLRPARIVMSHGCYVDWGPALQIALKKGLQVTSWMASYLTACFYVRHIQDPVRIDMHNISPASWEKCKATTLSPSQNQELDKFLEDRYLKNGSFDMKRFKQFEGKGLELRTRFGLDKDRPVWGLFTHINWDSVSDYSPMVYSSFNEWVIDTIKTIWELDAVTWIIKIHPAESWDNNPDSGVEAEIRRAYPELPGHIRIFSAEENISPLDFFNMVDGGITVYGTSGLELALHGKPVILAGEAHYFDKGFTYDSASIDQYRSNLRNAVNLGPLSSEQRQWARQYAYLYFIRRQILFPVVQDPSSKWWSFQYDKRNMLVKGADPQTEFLCDHIMSGEEFIVEKTS